MKNKIKGFIAGMLTTTIIGSCGVTTLAATGVISLQVTPARVIVYNQEFIPKDAKGNDALIFNYNGTVYAPLRSLAEAYGLQVGWDQQKQIATVGDANETPETPTNPNEPN